MNNVVQLVKFFDVNNWVNCFEIYIRGKMDISTSNLILGGAIGVISGVMASFLTYRYQLKISDKKREWDLKDKEREAIQKLEQSMIDQFESVINEIRLISNDFFFLMLHLSPNNEITNELIKKTISLSLNKQKLLAYEIRWFDIHSNILISNIVKLIEETSVLIFMFIEEKDKTKRDEINSKTGKKISALQNNLIEVKRAVDDNRYHIFLR